VLYRPTLFLRPSGSTGHQLAYYGETGTKRHVCKVKNLILCNFYRKNCYFRRYFVVVDEREIPGDIKQEMLFDKITAERRGIPYYVAAAFDKRTLTETSGRQFLIGDGDVHGGFLNYPLVKGKKYNWAFVTNWDINGQPVFGYYRGGSY